MRQWATGHGKAMQCATKGSAGALPLNMSHKELSVEERVELEYNDTNGTQKKTKELLKRRSLKECLKSCTLFLQVD